MRLRDIIFLLWLARTICWLNVHTIHICIRTSRDSCTDIAECNINDSTTFAHFGYEKCIVFILPSRADVTCGYMAHFLEITIRIVYSLIIIIILLANASISPSYVKF